jgi:hypothetical protein
VVTAYGPRGTYGEDGDIIRLVVEVGSLGRDLKPPSNLDKANTVRQLLRYLHVMGRMGVRWSDKAVGMCIIGTEVAISKSHRNGQFPYTTKWLSLYSDQFIQTIDDLASM